MAKQIESGTAAFVLTLVAIVSVLGTTAILTSGGPVPFITGFATSGANNTTATASVNVSEYVIMSLNSSVLKFGEDAPLTPGASDDTTDGNPDPLILTNDGNVEMNVSVQKNDDLFTTDVAGSLQIKALNDTAGDNAGCGTGGGTGRMVDSFADINDSPNPDQIIKNLGYVAANDTCAIHLKVTVPSDEPAGNYTSVLTFTGVKRGYLLLK
ncbi:MAG: hypothetical protein CL963_03105 [Euryarchaeota archaeon]|jgi:hypothetical protein|nr:hypothetical protein [Euryarchaeota archaeon]MDP6583931.1 hypothetical protein [Anaerolineales bacterium]|tara:strand:+ start:45890 stop:46522 length:633 start_codon:yes stop_codon:yes gene_type:complete